MAVRHQAAALPGIEIDRTKPIEQRDQFGSGAAGTATGNHQHAARRPQQINSAFDLGRIRTCDGTWLCVKMFFQLQRLRHDTAERVGWEIDIGGAGFAAFAEGPRDRFIQFLQHQRRPPDGSGIA
ncbi:MAG TPA: hypothetical protein VGD75_12955, partial [Bradyrhizobium sp.]